MKRGSGPVVDDDLVLLNGPAETDGDDEQGDPSPPGVTDGICPLRDGGPEPGVGENKRELILGTRMNARLEVTDLAQSDDQGTVIVDDPEGLADQWKKCRPAERQFLRSGRGRGQHGGSGVRH